MEELAREEVGRAGDPRVRGLRDDHVVALGRAREVRPPVVDDDAHARIFHRPAVVVVEEVRRLDHRRFDLDRVDALERIARRRPDGDAGGEADDERARRWRPEQERDVRQERLRAHVPGDGGVRLAVDLEEDGVVLAVDRDGGVEAVAVEDQLVVGNALDRQQLHADVQESHRRAEHAARELARVPGKGHHHEGGGGGEREDAAEDAAIAGSGGAREREQAGGGEVDGRSERERRAQAEQRDQHEAGDECAHGGADRVGEVDVTHGHAGGDALLRERARDEREERPQDERRRQHREHAEAEVEERQAARPEADDGAHEQVREVRQGERRHQ